MASYSGACFCGAVKLTVAGQPEAMGYCHCKSCRSWSAGPVNAFSLWKPEAAKITHGADKIASYRRARTASANGAASAAGIFSRSIRSGV